MEAADFFVRAAEPGDADALTVLANLPGVRRGTLRMPFTPRSFVEKRLADPGAGTQALVGVVDGQVVAQGGLVRPQSPRRQHVAELFLYVHDDHVGRGYGGVMLQAVVDLADHWLGLRRLELTVNVDNTRAIRLYERFGFKHEGTKRADVLRDGRLVDSYLMGRVQPAPAYR